MTEASTTVPFRTRDALIAAGLPVLLLLPFLGKAFHVDDPLFIWTAKHLLEDPISFYGFDTNWKRELTPIWQIMQNPPLLSYYLAPFGAAFGFGERAIHVVMLLPTALAGLGTYMVARRFCNWPLMATLLALLTPAFLVSASQVMSDVPMVACWLWALYFWLRGLEERQERWCIAAAVLIGVGTLTKYFAASMIPLLLLYTFLQPRSRWGLAWYLLVPLGMMLFYEFFTHRLYGVGLISDAGRYAREYRTDFSTGAGSILTHYVSKTFTGFVFTGGCIASVAFLTPWLWPRSIFAWGLRAFLVFFVFVALIIPYALPSFNPLQAVYEINFDRPGVALYSDKMVATVWEQYLQWCLFFVAGVQIAALTFYNLHKERDADALLLTLWIGGALIFCCYINHYVNGRVILPIAPAVAILAVRQLERRGWNRETFWRWAPGPLAVSTILTLVLCHADYRLAESAKVAAAEIMQEEHEGTVYFSGHSGFQYYMQELGAESIDIQRALATKGDRYVLPSNNWNPVQIGPHLVGDHKVFGYATVPYVSTSYYLRHAGFYSDDAGRLPYCFGPTPREEYLFVEVTAIDETDLNDSQIVGNAG